MLVAQRRLHHKPVIWLLPPLPQPQLDACNFERLAELVEFAVDAFCLAVCLDGPPGGEAQGIRLLAAEPRLGEAEVVALEEQAVRLGANAQALSITGRNGLPGLAFEEVPRREVRETDAERAHHAAAAPAAGELDLV